MSVSSARGGALAVFDLPVGLVGEGEEVQLIEVVVCKLAPAECSPEDIEEVVDGDGVVGCAVGGGDAVIIEFLPFPEIVVEEEGVTRDDVLAGVSNCAPEEDSLIFADGGDGVSEAS